METIHRQPLDSIAPEQVQLPLFLHIFQRAKQLNHSVQTSQLQISREDRSASGRRAESCSHSAIASTNLRENYTENCVDSAYLSAAQRDSYSGCSSFNTDGFYLYQDAPVHPFLDDAVGGEIKSCNTTGNVLSLSLPTSGTAYVLDEPGDGRNGKGLSMMRFPNYIWRHTPRVETKELISHSNDGVLSTATHDLNLDSPSSGMVTSCEFTSEEGMAHAIPNVFLTKVNDIVASTREVVIGSTGYCTSMVENAGSKIAPTREEVIDSTGYCTSMVENAGSKVAPYKVMKNEHDYDHASTKDSNCGTNAYLLVCDDVEVIPSTAVGDCKGASLVKMDRQTVGATISDNGLPVRDFTGMNFSGTSTSQEVSAVRSAHVPTPSMAEHPASPGGSPAEDHDAFSNGDARPSSFRQKWLGHFRGLSNSWQDLLRSQEESSIDHSGSFDSDSDYGAVISAVLGIARCLPKNEILQEHLQPFCGRINQHCGNTILYKLQKEQLFLPALSFFDWMRLHTPCLLNSRSLCTMFTILGDASMVDRAIVLYQNLRHCKELWVVQVFNALLSALSKHRRYDEALAIFKEMPNMKIRPDSVTFCILLNLAHKSGSSAKALWQIFLYMEKKVFAGHEVFGILMKAFCQEGLKDEALKLLLLMEERRLIPNIVIYNTLIGAFAKSGMLEEAEGLVSEMKGKGICMTLVTFNILIDAYASIQNFEVAEGLLQRMLDKGPQPNVHTFTALIAAYGRNFQSEKAASMFLRMKKHGVSPNAIAYTALIHAYAEDGWHKKAEYAFENMIREGFVPTVETYTSLLHAFRQAGDLEKIKSIWRRMRSERIVGTRVTFNVIMDAYAKQGEYAEARNVMNEFNKVGCKPDRKTYNMLINAYTRGGQHSKAPELLEEMQKAGFLPDSYTYTSLIFSFLRVREFTLAFEYHDKMCKDNQLPDKYTYKKLRNLLDEKYEVKEERNMKAAIGAQRAEHLGEEAKKLKRFRKRKKIFQQPGRGAGERFHNYSGSQGRLNMLA